MPFSVGKIKISLIDTCFILSSQAANDNVKWGNKKKQFITPFISRMVLSIFYSLDSYQLNKLFPMLGVELEI